MSNMPSKVDIQTAVPSKSRKPYTQDLQCTHGIMRPLPIFMREYIPNRNMSVKVDSFVRANPMPVPIFGHLKGHNRAFFVPYRTVMRDWNEFYTSTIYNYAGGSSAIPSSVPYTTNKALVSTFISHDGSNPGTPIFVTEVINPSDPSQYDIAVQVNTASPWAYKYYVFTNLGLHYLSVLYATGLKINWNVADLSQIPMINFMCYAKVMIDWYYPSQYVGDAAWNFVQSIFNNPTNGHNLDETEITGLLEVCNYITYNPDYFVNAWDNPSGPNNLNVERNVTISDVTNNAQSAVQGVTNYYANYPSASGTKPNNGTPFVGGYPGPGGEATSTGSATGVTTQYIIDALKSLTDYTKRHQLAGVRALDRYLAEMGIQLSAEILNRSMYLGSQDFDMEFYDVFSHGDTTPIGGLPVGGYAGKGNGFSGSKTFDYENGQEFGLFVVVNSFIPVIGYYQGHHREAMHLNCLDFYHGDFDHMAVQPIAAREVYVPTDAANSALAVPALNQTIFGYAPKYIEYNTPRDLQLGLYLAKSRNGLLPFYSLMRDLSFYDSGTLAQVKHNVGFVKGNDADQYSRIFYAEKGNPDQLNAIHHFEVVNVDSSLPAYDTYEFDEKNQTIKMDVGGAKMN